MLALEHRCRLANVVQAPVGTGANERKINFLSHHLMRRHDVVDGMFACHLWRQLRGINFKMIGVVRVGICAHGMGRLGTMGFEPCEGFFIGFQQCRFGAQFGCMVTQCHAIVYFHGLHRAAHILDGAVVQTLSAKLAQHVQGDVFGPNAGLQAALEHHPD